MSVKTGLGYYRHCLGVSQARMAEAMGLPIRTYEDIEAGRTVFRPVHLAAANMASLQIAVEKEDLGLLPLGTQDFVKKLASLAERTPASALDP